MKKEYYLLIIERYSPMDIEYILSLGFKYNRYYNTYTKISNQQEALKLYQEFLEHKTIRYRFEPSWNFKY